MKQKLNESSNKQYWITLKEANFSEASTKSQLVLDILYTDGTNSL